MSTRTSSAAPHPSDRQELRFQRRSSFTNFVRRTISANRDQPGSPRCECSATLLYQSKRTDQRLGDHLSRTSTYVHFLALEVGLGDRQAQSFSDAACLYDLGAIGMDPLVLEKSDRLTALEWEQIKQHTLIGAKMLTGSRCQTIRLAKVVAATHHEKWDGNGYPFGLRGDQIPLASRLVAIADQYDALRSRRPFRSAFDHSSACRILLEGDDRTRPTHFDPEISRAFRRASDRLEELADSTARYC